MLVGRLRFELVVAAKNLKTNILTSIIHVVFVGLGWRSRGHVVFGVRVQEECKSRRVQFERMKVIVSSSRLVSVVYICMSTGRWRTCLCGAEAFCQRSAPTVSSIGRLREMDTTERLSGGLPPFPVRDEARTRTSTTVSISC